MKKAEDNDAVTEDNDTPVNDAQSTSTYAAHRNKRTIPTRNLKTIMTKQKFVCPACGHEVVKHSSAGKKQRPSDMCKNSKSHLTNILVRR